MSNLIIFSLFLRLFIHVHCGTKTTRSKTFPRRFSLLLAVGICLLLVVVLAVLLVFRMRKRAVRQRHGVSRRLNAHELSPALFDANEIDTIRTVGAPTELPDAHDELKTII
jgi:hypothetical protein